MKKMALFVCLVLLGTVCFAQYSDDEIRQMVIGAILTADSDFSIYREAKRANDAHNKNNGTNIPYEFGQHKEGFTRKGFDPGHGVFSLEAACAASTNPSSPL